MVKLEKLFILAGNKSRSIEEIGRDFLFREEINAIN